MSIKPSKIKNNLIGWAFLNIFFVLPFLGLLLPISLALLITFFVFFKKKCYQIFHVKNIGFLAITSIFLIAAISILYSSAPSESIKKTTKLIAFLLIPLAFLCVNPNTILIEKAKKIFVYGCILLCITSLSLLLYHYIVSYETSHWYNFVQTSMGREYMPEDAMFLNTALIFLLFGKFSNTIKFISAILFLAVIILFGVRLGLLLNLLILFLYILLNFKMLFTIKKIALLLLSISFLFFLTHQNSYTQDKLYDSLEKIGINTKDKVSEIGKEYHNISLRTKMWQSSIFLIKEKPIFGHGAGVEKKELSKVYEGKGYNMPAYNAHNQFLSTTIQFGFLGLFILLFIFILLFRQAILNKDLPNLLLILIMLLSMQTESYLEIQQGYFYFCIFASLLIIENNNKKIVIENQNNPSFTRRWRS